MTTSTSDMTRRTFIDALAGAARAIILSPIATGCAPRAPAIPPRAAEGDPLSIPRERPEGWDPIAFNKSRGNAGAIPEDYRDEINGPDGPLKHVGKHLPYVPTLPNGGAPAGVLPLMWGDPSKGRALHPNAAPSEANRVGHWYNWIRIRRAVAEDAAETESRFSMWPHAAAGDTGSYGALRGDDPSRDDGKNTVYLVALPADVKPGDLVRVHAHCLTHGEYVDFVIVPQSGASRG